MIRSCRRKKQYHYSSVCCGGRCKAGATEIGMVVDLCWKRKKDWLFSLFSLPKLCFNDEWKYEEYKVGYKYRRSVKILPGVRLNFNKHSTGVTIGGKYAKTTVNSNGRVTNSYKTPIKGLYYSETTNIKKGSTAPKKTLSQVDKLDNVRMGKSCGKWSMIIGIILSVASFPLNQPIIFAASSAFYIVGIPCYLIYRAADRRLSAQIAKEKRRAEIQSEQREDI